jgi:uncharacterized protein (DUF2062 family)
MEFVDERLIRPIVTLLTQGVTVEKLALSLAFGISLGIFPVLGGTSLLCFLAAVVFRLNLPAIQLVNWLVYPLQLILIIPFIRTGELLFGSHSRPPSLSQLLAMIHANALHAIAAFWMVTLQAVSVWCLISPLLIFVLHVLFLRVVNRLASATTSGMQAR